MRIGFFSDVHANWEALSACLQEFEHEGLSKLFFLGDAVGYGADPNLVVEKIDEICETVILGNHDAAVIGMLSSEYFNRYAQVSFHFTKEVLKPENLELLKNFPMTADYDIFTLVHALPRDPESWGYISTLREADENFGHFDTQVCLIGHSHRPFVVEKSPDGEAQLITSSEIELKPESRYIINVGSVGQPRDGNPDACFVIYNDEEKLISFRRVAYDIETAQDKMRKANIPGYLVKRLSVGR